MARATTGFIVPSRVLHGAFSFSASACASSRSARDSITHGLVVKIFGGQRDQYVSVSSREDVVRPRLLFARTIFPASSRPLLAAKSKKVAGGGKDKNAKSSAAAAQTVAPGAGDVFNIYANVPDVKLLPDESYPKLWNLERAGPTYGELSLMFIYGQRIEEATLSLYERFLRMHRKLCIKVNNLRLKKSKRRAQIQVD